MKSSFATARPKRFRRCALGTLLLALPLGGIAFRLPPVQAQPALPTPAKTSPKPLTPEQKAMVQMYLAIAQQEKLCKMPLDFQVESATLEGIIEKLKQTFPTQNLTVEVRGASPVRVSFDLKKTNVGNVLNNVAALAGCKLFLRSKGLLIAPTSSLSEAEQLDIKDGQGGEWGKNTGSGGSGWSVASRASELFTNAVAQEATGSAADHLSATVVRTTFGNFSPESQAILTEMASWASAGAVRLNPQAPVLHLDPSSPVTVDTTQPNSVSVRFPAGFSNPGGQGMGVTNTIVNITADP